MRVLKHSLLSLVRKPTKVIMMFVILFVVFGLIFTGIIIENSIEESKIYIRKELGAVVEYTTDYMKAYEDEIEDYEAIQPSVRVAQDIAKDSRVKELCLVNIDTLVSNDLFSGVENNYEEEMYEGYEMYFSVWGYSTQEPLNFINGNVTLTEGEFFSEEDMANGNFVLIISEEVAAKNNLSVGDFIKMKNWDQEVFDFEIIGLYEGAEEYEVDNMYTPYDTISQFIPYEMQEDYAAMIYFVLDDPLEVDAFIEDNEGKLPTEYNYFNAAKEQYEQLTKPLDLISAITAILIVVVFFSGAIIAIAIITMFVRDRKFEIGLLLASGESKIKVAIQFILEILYVSIVAFGIAVLASNFTSVYVSDWITENQLVEEDEIGDNYYYYNSYSNGFGDVNMENVAEEFNVSLNFEVIMNLFVISLVLVFIAACAPLTVIMAFKPRQALQD